MPIFKKSFFRASLTKVRAKSSLGGTRLKRFMDSVDKATNPIPDPMPQQPSAKALSGLTIETDKVSGQRHLKLPMLKKETLQGIANLFNEFVKRT